MNKLILTSPALPGRRVELVPADLPVSLGRSKSADITIADALLSRLHSEIRADESGRFEIVDLDSTNLTIVNGHDVIAHLLKSGDEIFIGDTTIRVKVQLASTEASEQTTRDLPLMRHGANPDADV